MLPEAHVLRHNLPVGELHLLNAPVLNSDDHATSSTYNSLLYLNVKITCTRGSDTSETHCENWVWLPDKEIKITLIDWLVNF
jgi:hypothetical protein